MYVRTKTHLTVCGCPISKFMYKRISNCAYTHTPNLARGNEANNAINTSQIHPYIRTHTQMQVSVLHARLCDARARKEECAARANGTRYLHLHNYIKCTRERFKKDVHTRVHRIMLARANARVGCEYVCVCVFVSVQCVCVTITSYSIINHIMYAGALMRFRAIACGCHTITFRLCVRGVICAVFDSLRMQRAHSMKYTTKSKFSIVIYEVPHSARTPQKNVTRRLHHRAQTRTCKFDYRKYSNALCVTFSSSSYHEAYSIEIIIDNIARAYLLSNRQ